MDSNRSGLTKFVEKFALGISWIPIIAVIFYFTIPLGNIQATHFDVLLVLGYPSLTNGQISPEQRERVLEAVRQYQSGVAPIIIFSGGAVKNRFVEADTMAAFARSSGVPASAIVEERRARNTIENVEYSTQIMHTHGWDSVEAITSSAHERRASLILMHAPFPVNWRMRAARWPQEYGPGQKLARYLFEISAGASMRIFGFHEKMPDTAVSQH